MSEGGRQWNWSKDWIGVTLQSTSDGGRQRFGSKAGTWSDFKEVQCWRGNQEWMINFKEGSKEGTCSLPVRFGDRLTAP